MKLIIVLTGITILLVNTSTESNAAEPSVMQSQTIKGGILPYELSIPAAWEFARNQEHFDIFTTAKDSGGNFWLGVYAIAEAQGDTERWAELLTQGRFTGVWTRSNPATIDSHKWAVLDGTIQADGTTLTCRLYAYAEEGSAYAIMLVATPSAWPSHMTELMTIARSFKFPTK